MTGRLGPARKAEGAYHHGNLHAALIQAATTQIERDGPGAVSLAALAKSVGVSQPAPYRHFADRNALLAAVAVEGFRAFCGALQASMGTGQRRSAEQSCPEIDKVAEPETGETIGRRMARAYVAFGSQRPGVYRLMFASRLLTDAPADSELKSVAQEAFALLVSALPPSDGRERRALLIWAALHGVVMLALEGLLHGPTQAATLDQLIDDVVGYAS